MNEKENTARILGDKPELVTGFWCRFGMHRWTKWGKPYQPNKNTDKYIQTRECAHCAEFRVRKVYPYREHL